MRTKPSLRAFALVLPLVLSACASRPTCPPPRPMPEPPADLMQPAPEEGSFRRRLDEISGQNSTP